MRFLHVGPLIWPDNWDNVINESHDQPAQAIIRAIPFLKEDAVLLDFALPDTASAGATPQRV